MNYILDPAGHPVRAAKDDQLLQRYAQQNAIERVAIDRLEDDAGKLTVTFANGNTFEKTDQFDTLLEWVRLSRLLNGVEVFVDGQPIGRVHYQNRALVGGSCRSKRLIRETQRENSDDQR